MPDNTTFQPLNKEAMDRFTERWNARDKTKDIIPFESKGLIPIDTHTEIIAKLDDRIRELEKKVEELTPPKKSEYIIQLTELEVNEVLKLWN